MGEPRPTPPSGSSRRTSEPDPGQGGSAAAAASEPEKAPDAEVKGNDAVSQPDDTAPQASGERKRYRAIASYGEGDDAVANGEEFEALPGDPRIHATLSFALPDGTPPAVAAAFDAAGTPDGVGDTAS